MFGAFAVGEPLAFRLAVERTRREPKLVTVTNVVEAAQRATLLPLSDTVGPLRPAGRYLSATADARVGGDFYEARATHSALHDGGHTHDDDFLVLVEAATTERISTQPERSHPCP